MYNSTSFGREDATKHVELCINVK